MTGGTVITPKSLAGQRVLVIGAAGFLGRHVVEAVLTEGGAAIGLDRNPAPATFAGQGWHVAEATDIDLIRRLAQDATDVIFLAGHSRPAGGYASLASEIDTEVTYALAAAEACRDAGVARFIFASSGGTVYGADVAVPTTETEPTTPRSSYGLAKLVVEHGLRLIAQQGQMRAIVLRISNPYGPGQLVKRQQGIIAAAMNALMSGQALEIWGDGSVIRDFLYVSDTAAAFTAALRSTEPYLLVNIGSGQGVSIRDLCDEIARISGHPLNRTYLPDRSVDLPVAILDPSLAQKTLGWTPRVGLADGLRHTYDWWKKEQRNTP